MIRNDCEPYIGMPVCLDGELDPGILDTESEICLSELPVAMAYVPMQEWEQPYEINEGFGKGTIFPCLDLPFKGGRK